jgi:hypothetical protein
VVVATVELVEDELVLEEELLDELDWVVLEELSPGDPTETMVALSVVASPE